MNAKTYAVHIVRLGKRHSVLLIGSSAPFLLSSSVMANDEKGAIEDEVEKIEAIRGKEALGYEGGGREEHSGENSPVEPDDLRDELADNRPEDLT